MADRIFAVVRIGRDPKDTYAAPMLGEAIELAMPDPGDVVEHGTVRASDAGAARLKKPQQWKRLKAKGSDWYNVSEGGEIPNPPHQARLEFDKLFRNSTAMARDELWDLMQEAAGSIRKAKNVLAWADHMLGWKGVLERDRLMWVSCDDEDRITVMYDIDREDFAIGSVADYMEEEG